MPIEYDSSKKKSKALTPKAAKLKAADYCAYQERSQQEVRKKLYEYHLNSDDVEEILYDLIVDGFINEERFAKAYIGGKFRMKGWGRNKILQGLKQHNISEYCIKKGLEEIDDVSYRETLTLLIEKKITGVASRSDFEKKQKVAHYAISRGFEPWLVWEVLKEY